MARVQRRWPATSLSVRLSLAKLVLDDVRFDLEIRQFITKTLSLYPQRLSFLLSVLDLFLQQDSAFDRHVVFGFQIL